VIKILKNYLSEWHLKARLTFSHAEKTAQVFQEAALLILLTLPARFADIQPEDKTADMPTD
jgi:hypothetical protein